VKKIKSILILLALIIAAIFFAAYNLSGFGFSTNNTRQIVCLGDSLTYGYGSDVSYPEILGGILDANVINAGVCGRNSQTLLNKLNDYISADTDTVILFIGANDIYHDENMDTKANIEGIIKSLQKRDIEVVICNYPYTKIERYFTDLDAAGIEKYHDLISGLNQDIKDLSLEYNIQLIDLEKCYKELLDNGTYKYDEIFSDGVHFNELGYTIMAKYISEKL